MRSMNARQSVRAPAKSGNTKVMPHAAVSSGLARSAEGISRAIYASKDFTLEAFLSDFAHVKPRGK